MSESITVISQIQCSWICSYSCCQHSQVFSIHRCWMSFCFKLWSCFQPIWVCWQQRCRRAWPWIGPCSAYRSWALRWARMPGLTCTPCTATPSPPPPARGRPPWTKKSCRSVVVTPGLHVISLKQGLMFISDAVMLKLLHFIKSIWRSEVNSFI